MSLLEGSRCVPVPVVPIVPINVFGMRVLIFLYITILLSISYIVYRRGVAC